MHNYNCFDCCEDLAYLMLRLPREEMCLCSNYVRYRSCGDKSPKNKQNLLNFGFGLKTTEL